MPVEIFPQPFDGVVRAFQSPRFPIANAGLPVPYSQDFGEKLLGHKPPEALSLKAKTGLVKLSQSCYNPNRLPTLRPATDSTRPVWCHAAQGILPISGLNVIASRDVTSRSLQVETFQAFRRAVQTPDIESPSRSENKIRYVNREPGCGGTV